MRKRKDRPIHRLYIIIAILAAFSLVALTAYNIMVVKLNVNIEEVINIEPSTIDIDLDPNETVTQDFVITNTGRADLQIELRLLTQPLPVGITLTFPTNLRVPAKSTITITARITAPANVPPGVHTIDIIAVR